MADYLLSQNLVITLSAVTAILVVAYLKAIYRANGPGPRLRLALMVAALFFLFELLLVAAGFGLENLPATIYYLLPLADFLLAANLLYWRLPGNRRTLGLSSGLAVLMLLAASLNVFYQFYPNFGAIFANKHRQYSHGSGILSASNVQVSATPTSLEGQLYPQMPIQGSINEVPVPGQVSAFKARNALVYLPPAYTRRTSSTASFPVIILLTGVPGSPTDWLHGEHLQQTMDEFAVRHRGVTPIVILADHNGTFSNDTECVDSSRGNVETYLTTDLPTFVKTNFNATSSPDSWAIGGLSEGGMCAAMLSLRHQDVYRHFLDMSGDPMPFLGTPAQTQQILFGGSHSAQQQHDVDWLLANQPVTAGMTAQFIIGGNDDKALISKMRHTYRLAAHKGMSASFEIIPNEGHNAKAWGRGFRESLPKLSYAIGATNCETGCPKQR